VPKSPLVTITLIIRPYHSPKTNKRVHGRFEARLNGRLICTSSQPLLDGARVLLAEGLDPASPIAMRHEGASYDALRSTVGTAAKLTVRETETEGPRFVRWKPFSGGDVHALMRFSSEPVTDTGQPERVQQSEGGSS
jgi:hypothetical protein